MRWVPTSHFQSNATDNQTAAMRACVTHLLPAPPVARLPEVIEIADDNEEKANGIISGSTSTPEKAAQANGAEIKSESDAPAAGGVASIKAEEKSTPVPSRAASPAPGLDSLPSSEVIEESARIPLDAAIASSISFAGNENKIKAAASTILVIGGSSSLKGLNAFLAER